MDDLRWFTNEIIVQPGGDDAIVEFDTVFFEALKSCGGISIPRESPGRFSNKVEELKFDGRGIVLKPLNVPTSDVRVECIVTPNEQDIPFAGPGNPRSGLQVLYVRYARQVGGSYQALWFRTTSHTKIQE